MNIWDFKNFPASVVGKGYHKAVETYYSTGDVHSASEAALHEIEYIKDDDIDYGKTGSREKIINDFTQTFDHFLGEEPDVGDVIDLEKKIVVEWNEPDFDINECPLAIKVIIDCVSRTSEGLTIWDWKKVTTFTDPNEERPDYIMQAMFYYYASKFYYKETPVKMIFHEVKTSKNKDGSPQTNTYEVVFADVPQYKKAFCTLFGAVVKELSRPDLVFLPNFADQFDGKQDWEDFTKEIVSIDSPAPVHRTKAAPKYVDKQFVESHTDNFDNRNLEPQEAIKAKLLEFGIAVEPQDIYKGASINKYSFKVSRGVKMANIKARKDDIAYATGAKAVRVDAPIPGTKLIGVEVPREDRQIISFDEVYEPHKSSLIIPIGSDVYGEVKYDDLAKMPHLLIAGSTGSGKSVMVSSILKALIKQNSVDEMGLILIDPKQVELSAFRHDEHLKIPIVYEEVEAIKALQWAVDLMQFRYRKLRDNGFKNIDEWNKNNVQQMQKIVIVIDEFADLMTGPNREFTEQLIIRLAQLARAAGIHMVIATQRPTVNVITGNIKTNMPTRIAFFMPSSIDSKTILDEAGAEDLTGKGDMLFMSASEAGLLRLQGLFIND